MPRKRLKNRVLSETLCSLALRDGSLPAAHKFMKRTSIKFGRMAYAGSAYSSL